MTVSKILELLKNEIIKSNINLPEDLRLKIQEKLYQKLLLTLKI